MTLATTTETALASPPLLLLPSSLSFPSSSSHPARLSSFVDRVLGTSLEAVVSIPPELDTFSEGSGSHRSSPAVSASASNPPHSLVLDKSSFILYSIFDQLARSIDHQISRNLDSLPILCPTPFTPDLPTSLPTSHLWLPRCFRPTPNCPSPFLDGFLAVVAIRIN